jgi:hypothetical protein
LPAENPFSGKWQNIATSTTLTAKTRLAAVSGLLDKVKRSADAAVEQEPEVRQAAAVVARSEAPKIEPESDDVTIFTTSEPRVYTSTVQSIIDRLSDKAPML